MSNINSLDPKDSSENTHVERITIPNLENRIRLSDFVPENSAFIGSRKAMKKAIKKGLIYLNNDPANTGDFISGGEILDVFKVKDNDRKSYDLNLEVLYEDDYLAVVNKAAGLVVSGNQHRTLENALPHNLKSSTEKVVLDFPQAIHRLDFPTSGLVLIGKTIGAVNELNQIFVDRKIAKKYLAVCIGEMPLSGIIDTPIDGKKSHSEYRVLEQVKSDRFSRLNLVEVELITGRKHQIRKHMLSIGHPVLGDKEYNLEGLVLRGKGLYLHSYALKFEHPFTEKIIEIKSEIPKKFVKIFS